jgi:hypothetical protein
MEMEGSYYLKVTGNCRSHAHMYIYILSLSLSLSLTHTHTHTHTHTDTHKHTHTHTHTYTHSHTHTLTHTTTHRHKQLTLVSQCIEHNVMLGLLRPNVRSRFLYYVSDLPLSVGTSLATKMTAWEGVPPLYAITRTLMQKVCAPIQAHDFAGRAAAGAPMHADASHAAVSAAQKWQTIRKGQSTKLSMWIPHHHIHHSLSRAVSKAADQCMSPASVESADRGVFVTHGAGESQRKRARMQLTGLDGSAP